MSGKRVKHTFDPASCFAFVMMLLICIASGLALLWVIKQLWIAVF